MLCSNYEMSIDYLFIELQKDLKFPKETLHFYEKGHVIAKEDTHFTLADYKQFKHSWSLEDN